MKYGIIYNKSNVNIGDDIQAYATARFLPQIDYLVDREHIDEFRPDDDEPVAVIMNAWYMWAKWNWPPSKYIVPKMVGFHYADHQLAKQPGSPIKYEFLTGLGADYLKAYSPVGCRDMFTKSNLEKEGIDSYFSGCITLTLPKMPETKNKGSYICLVDLEKSVVDKLAPMLRKQGIEVKIITHNRERDPDMSWEDRCKLVEDRLTLYQNARCVVTKRLHCALPCLAMDVPVFLIKQMTKDIRFDPYYDFLYRTTVTDFLKDNYEYDFLNPPANKGMHLECREGLIKSCEEFIASVKNETRSVDELVKTTYTEDELIRWRHDTMKKTMDMWLTVHRDLQESSKQTKKADKKTISSLKSSLEKAEAKNRELEKLIAGMRESSKKSTLRNLLFRNKKERG